MSNLISFGRLHEDVDVQTVPEMPTSPHFP